MSKVLGVDYGLKRIGIAVGDTVTRIASPLGTIEGRNDPVRDARTVVDLAVRQEAAALVVGLPLNMDGTEGPQAELTRRFGDELKRLSGLPIHYQDERLSSDAAEQALAEAGYKKNRRKGLADRVAAQMILQAYLDRAWEA